MSIKSYSEKIRVGIDGFLLEKPRGLGRYLQELLYAFNAHPNPRVELTVWVPALPNAQLLAKFPRVHFRVLRKVPFPIWEQVVLPFEIRSGRYDLCHFPYNTKPIAMSFSHVPHVVTVHDLTFMRESGTGLYQQVGSWYRNIVVRSSVRGRNFLVTDSEASQRDIQLELNQNAEVVPISVGMFLANVNAKPSQAKLRRQRPYFLHIGGISPHKNTRRVVDAFIEASLSEVDLVILGMSSETPLAKEVSSETIIFPGWLDDTEVVALIRGAVAMVFPSLREGYGLPIVEGFALGCPVITSNIPPMCELADNAALLVDPKSTRELSEAIRRLHFDEPYRSILASQGLERMEKFSTLEMATKMTDIYVRASEL